jgi:EthD domain
MEKVILTLQGGGDDQWCERIRGPVAQQILELGVPGLSVNVKDAAVRDSLMTLTTLDPPVCGLVTLWTEQHYGSQVTDAVALLAKDCDAVSGYLVTESVPLASPQAEYGTRTTGFANIALLRRPEHLDEETWRSRWHSEHTLVAIETQATFGYTQNAVVRPLTSDAPALAAIVEELFPAEGLSDLKAFFGAADDDDLADRLARMVASTSAFGANDNVDTVPTSRYVFRSPFAAS